VRRTEIEGNLKKTKPYADIIQSTGEKVMDPEAKLDALRLDYMSKRASMSESNPDIIALKKEIAELEKVVTRKQKLADAQKRLTSLEAEQAALRGKMTADHPDLAKVNREIEQVRQEVSTLSKEIDSNQEAAAREPDNPAYIDLQTQLGIAELNIKEGQEKLSHLQARAAECQRHIQATPEVEKAYLTLTRDYDNLKDKYQEVLKSASDASDARGIEAEHKGERFTVLDQASVPQTPSWPNVPVVVLVGFVLSVSVGAASVYVAELSDNAVRTAESLRGAVTPPVLSTIPYVDDEHDIRQRKCRRWLQVVLALLFVLFMVWSAFYYLVNYT
jgi:predicted  nucleic acid-binding Zn-ribbon protein